MVSNYRVVITPGEPAGIGPDLTVQLAQRDWPVELVVCADGNVLRQRAQQLGLPLTLRGRSQREHSRCCRLIPHSPSRPVN